MILIDLSHTVSSGMAQYPGDHPAPRLVRQFTHDEHGAQSSRLEMGCHVGTHIDSPLHFRAGQPGLEELPVTTFAGAGLVLDAPGGDPPGALGAEILDGVDLVPVDYLLLRTGWERHWGTRRYYECWPFLAPELARSLVAADLRGVGLDGPSVDPLDGRIVHDLFASAGMINVENLANLSALPAGLFTFLTLPLKLDGAEASPVRAVALIDR